MGINLINRRGEKLMNQRTFDLTEYPQAWEDA